MSQNEPVQSLEHTLQHGTGDPAAASGNLAPHMAAVWIGRLGLLVSLIGAVSRGLVAPLGLGLCLAAVNRRMTPAGLLGALLGLGGTIAALDLGVKPIPVDIRPQPFQPDLMAVERQLASVSGWFKLYEAQHGEYPTTEQGWSVIPQAQPVPQDVWGNPLAYERPAPDWCEIRSLGPDGHLKTDDDRAMPIYKLRSTNPASLAFWKERRSVLIRSALLFFVGLIGAMIVVDRCGPAGCTTKPSAETP